VQSPQYVVPCQAVQAELVRIFDDPSVKTHNSDAFPKKHSWDLPKIPIHFFKSDRISAWHLDQGIIYRVDKGSENCPEVLQLNILGLSLDPIGS